MLTVEDVFEYVGVEAEYADDVQTRRADRALKASRMWLIGAVGKRSDLCDPLEWIEWPLAEETMLMAAGEMYENRVLVDTNLSKYAGSKAAASLNRLAYDSISQLKYCDLETCGCCGETEDEPNESEESEEPEDTEEPEEGDL